MLLTLVPAAKAKDPAISALVTGFHVDRNENNRYFLEVAVTNNSRDPIEFVGSDVDGVARLDPVWGGVLKVQHRPNSKRWDTEMMPRYHPLEYDRITVSPSQTRVILVPMDEYFLVMKPAETIYRYSLSVIDEGGLSTDEFSIERLRLLANPPREQGASCAESCPGKRESSPTSP
jgi:hypothetical protein